MSTLRQRMTEAMVLRGFAERTKETYLITGALPTDSGPDWPIS